MARHAASDNPVRQERTAEAARRFTRPIFLLQVGLLVFLVLCPFLFSSFRVVDLVVKVVVFAVVVASYDLIIGYTGIMSLGHGMFFGIGAYSLALMVYHAGAPQWYHLPLAVAAAVIISVSLAVLIGFFSLRVKAFYFAFVTLALAEFAHLLGYRWYDLTSGENGVSFKLPGVLSLEWSAGPWLGVEVNGRLLTYYLIVVAAVLLFIGMARLVRSPLGRVLKGIRDNSQRAAALGYPVFLYQLFPIVFGSVIASLGGILFAMWLNYVSPESVLGTPTMLNILLMVIIGGLGTLYGSIIGAAFIKTAETWLPDLQKLVAGILPHAEMMQRLAERWILYFGVMFILVVFFFPRGIVGTARLVLARRRQAAVPEE